MKSAFFSILIVFILSTNFATASSAVSIDPPVLVELIEQDFPIFRDADEKILYVDFELLTTNLKTLKIVDSDGKTTFEDDVRDEMVDAIYEIDYTNLSSGKYSIELHDYTDEILHSEFTIK